MRSIKRIALVLIVTAVLLLCLSIGAGATEAPMIIGSNAIGTIGGYVDVTIGLDNNPGITVMSLTIEYDEAVLQLEEVLDAGVLGVNFHKDNMVSPYLLSWANDTAEENFVVNGTIATLRFWVKDTAYVGNTYDIAISYDYENYDIYDKDLIRVHFDTTNANISIAESTSSITSANMELSTDITVNYLVDLDPSHVGAQMKFTMSNIERLVDGEATGNGNEYKFPFQGVSPQCMGDNIKAELILNGEVLDACETYSVKEYCENTLAKTAEELGMSTEKHAALQTLIKDMLVYGAKAQLYRDYKTDALVDANVTGSAFTKLTETAKEIYETDLEGVEVVGLGVYFDYVNSMYVRFTAPGMTEKNFKIVLTEADNEENVMEYTLADCMAVEGQADTYLLVLEPSMATEYDAVWYIDLYTVSGRKTTCVQYNTYSITSYVYAMQDRTTDGVTLSPMAQLARAVYNYGLAANAYAAISD